MSEENKPSETNSSEKEGNENVEPVSSTDSAKTSLEALKKITGREFESVEEYEKHYKGLNDLVGDQTLASNRKDSERLGAIKTRLTGEAADKGFNDPDEYLDYLMQNNQVEPSKPSQPDISSVEDWRKKNEDKAKNEERDSQFNDLLEFKQKSELGAIFPELTKNDEYFELVRSVAAKIGEKDLTKVVKGNSVLSGLVDADRSKQATSVVETNQKVTPEDSKGAEAAVKAVIDNPNSEEARMRLAEVAMKNQGVQN